MAKVLCDKMEASAADVQEPRKNLHLSPLSLFLWNYLRNRVYHRIPHGLWQLTNAILKEQLGLLRMIP